MPKISKKRRSGHIYQANNYYYLWDYRGTDHKKQIILLHWAGYQLTDPIPHPQPNYADKILTTIHTYGLASQVYLLGIIPRCDQIQLMRHSLAVIQPSLFEGWSTVVEDARCLGKKIILSDFPVHLEQNPLGCKFFEQNSAQNLAKIMAEWWEQLPSEPDIDQENIARIRNKEDVQTFGYRFLDIARGSISSVVIDTI